MSCTDPDCPAPVHGTSSAYRHGCRSDEAVAVHARENKARRCGRYEYKIVDGLGTRRRLQALAAIGWSSKKLAAELGVQWRAINQYRSKRHRPTARNADRIAALYEQLSMTPGGDEATKKDALRRGWAPPLAWDDPDNPREKPKFGEDERATYLRKRERGVA